MIQEWNFLKPIKSPINLYHCAALSPGINKSQTKREKEEKGCWQSHPSWADGLWLRNQHEMAYDMDKQAAAAALHSA